MRYEVRKRKPIPFSWRFEVVMKKKWRFVQEWHGEFERVSSKEEDEQSEMFEGKLERFKNWPFLHKTRDFHDWIKLRISRQVQSPEHLKGKLSKNFLSVFSDWKFHSWESHELSYENLCVPLATGHSICEQVTNLSRKMHEKPDFWKIF